MKRWMGLATISATLSLAPAARADDNASANELFEAGAALMKQGDVAAACAKFDSSLGLDSSLDTQVALAACREKNHQLATALSVAMRALDASERSRDPADLAFRDMLAAQVESLRLRQSKLTVIVEAALQVPGLEVLRAGTVLPVGAWSTRLSIDAGAYLIVARAPGYTEWSTTVTVGNEKDSQVVAIPKLVLAPVKLVPGPVTVAPTPGGGPVLIRQHGSSSRTPAWVALGGTALLAGGAVVLESHGRSLRDEADRLLPGSPAQRQRYADADTPHIAAQIVGGVALVGVGVTIYLFVRGGGNADDAGTRVGAFTVTPAVGVGYGGVGLSTRW